jgi:spore coat polysaccharide biosynthesis protein SpsF (cytidylyltransferase family)
MIFIQARSTSTRFPNKIMEKIGDWTLLEWVYNRLEPIGMPIAFLLPYFDPAIQYIQSKGWNHYVGPEDNVLSRFYKAAKRFEVSGCLRITADCPFISSEKALAVISKGVMEDYDFVSNCVLDQVDGHEAEWMSMAILDKMWAEAEEGDHEHVTTWAKRTIGHNGFKSYVFGHDFTAKLVGKLSVDTPEDLERLRKIMEDQNAGT